MMDGDGLDGLLRSAMRARPEAVAGVDVAREALVRVRRQEEAMARLKRIGWWTRVSSVAAMVLITVTVAVGYWVWPAASAASGTSAAGTDATTTAVSSGTYNVDMMTVGVAAFVVMLVVVGLMAVMTPEREGVRLAM